MVPSGSSGSRGGVILEPPSLTESKEEITICSKNSRISPAKKWCFTWNNYTETSIDEIINSLNEKDDYIIGKEVGANGTPHLQGFIQFYTKVRPKSVIKNTQIHWEKCKGTKMDNYTYCSKDNNFVANFRGPYRGPQIELRQWQKDIVEILKQEPNDRTIHWFWESKGNFGKTTFQKWLHKNFKNVILLSGKASDMKNGLIQYEEVNKELPEIILINIPRNSHDFVSYTGLEEIKDMFFFSGKYKGGMVNDRPPHLLVFANDEPAYYKMSEDRWNVTKLR